MSELSPAAQAVLDAVVNRSHPLLAGMGAGRDQYARKLAPTAAAALRALADHQPAPTRLGAPLDHWSPDARTRRELHNIADELECFND